MAVETHRVLNDLIKKHDQNLPLIICGDMNSVTNEIHRGTGSFTSYDRIPSNLVRLLENNSCADTHELRFPDHGHFTRSNTNSKSYLDRFFFDDKAKQLAPRDSIRYGIADQAACYGTDHKCVLLSAPTLYTARNPDKSNPSPAGVFAISSPSPTRCKLKEEDIPAYKRTLAEPDLQMPLPKAIKIWWKSFETQQLNHDNLTFLGLDPEHRHSANAIRPASRSYIQNKEAQDVAAQLGVSEDNLTVDDPVDFNKDLKLATDRHLRTFSWAARSAEARVRRPAKGPHPQQTTDTTLPKLKLFLSSWMRLDPLLVSDPLETPLIPPNRSLCSESFETGTAPKLGTLNLPHQNASTTMWLQWAAGPDGAVHDALRRLIIFGADPSPSGT